MAEEKKTDETSAVKSKDTEQSQVNGAGQPQVNGGEQSQVNGAEQPQADENTENGGEQPQADESAKNTAKPLKTKFRKRAKNFFAEFGKFLKQGNVIDLAVAFVVGAAFREIVSSLVADVIMPLIAAIGGVSVSDWSVVLNYGKDGAPNILHYGKFIQTIIDFVIISLAIFVAVRTLTRVRSFMEKGAKHIKDKVELVIKDNGDDKNDSGDDKNDTGDNKNDNVDDQASISDNTNDTKKENI